MALGSFRREDRPGAVRAGSFLPIFAPGIARFAPINQDFAGLKRKPRERRLDAGEIAGPEQPDMHQPGIEIVEA